MIRSGKIWSISVWGNTRITDARAFHLVHKRSCCCVFPYGFSSVKEPSCKCIDSCVLFCIVLHVYEVDMCILDLFSVLTVSLAQCTTGTMQNFTHPSTLFNAILAQCIQLGYCNLTGPPVCCSIRATATDRGPFLRFASFDPSGLRPGETGDSAS